jgi:small subunit ribosomal protein S8
MLINDPVGDALTRIRNAQVRQKKDVTFPNSKILVSLAQILKSEGYIQDYEITTVEDRKYILVTLRYIGKNPAITKLKRVSKPGLRRYVGYRDIPRVLNGMGIAIITSPKGVMTGQEAIKNKVGGEFLCTIY